MNNKKEYKFFFNKKSVVTVVNCLLLSTKAFLSFTCSSFKLNFCGFLLAISKCVYVNVCEHIYVCVIFTLIKNPTTSVEILKFYHLFHHPFSNHLKPLHNNYFIATPTPSRPHTNGFSKVFQIPLNRS